MKRSLFLFRRDLRVFDNKALNEALKASDEVILAFIFNPKQIEENAYKSLRCLQFMIESLEDLQESIKEKGGKLYLFYGYPEIILEECIQKLSLDAVYLNADYTPFSIERDKKLEKVCQKLHCSFISFDDFLLHPVDSYAKDDGTPYTVFTPFYKKSLKSQVAKPEYLKSMKFYSKPIAFAKDSELFNKILPQRFKQAKGGRKEAIRLLKQIPLFTSYQEERDYPSLDKTTHLSAHLKFNTVSVREVYHIIASEFGRDFALIRSLYWRDFFTLISLNFPHIYKGAFKPKYDAIAWSENEKLFQAWCEGQTGYPIVDAAMRELNETGYMHNRARMIVASFLTKDLHIHWKLGEQYFATHLIDYDPAVNNGNWQWSSSTGCDAQPYFRIFNPGSQSQKFDPEALYIKKWVPELKSLSPKEIHAWHQGDSENLFVKYKQPIVNHNVESKKALDLFRSL